MLGLINEIKATTALSILDTMRQRSLLVEDAAEIAGIDVDRMRSLVVDRAAKNFGLDDLEEILEALEDTAAPRP